MEAKLDALEVNNTWLVTDLPPRKNAIDCKYVFKTNYKSDNTVEKEEGPFGS